MMLCHYKLDTHLTNTTKAKGGVIRLDTNIYISQEKKNQNTVLKWWDNAHSRWRFHKEEDAHHRCTTCQKQTESQATCTMDIIFNKKVLLYSVQHIDRAVQSVLQTTEIVSLHIQQLSGQQQERWLYSTWQIHVFYLHSKCTLGKKAMSSYSLASSLLILFTCITCS